MRMEMIKNNKGKIIELFWDIITMLVLTIIIMVAICIFTGCITSFAGG